MGTGADCHLKERRFEPADLAAREADVAYHPIVLVCRVQRLQADVDSSRSITKELDGLSQLVNVDVVVVISCARKCLKAGVERRHAGLRHNVEDDVVRLAGVLPEATPQKLGAEGDERGRGRGWRREGERMQLRVPIQGVCHASGTPAPAARPSLRKATIQIGWDSVGPIKDQWRRTLILCQCVLKQQLKALVGHRQHRTRAQYNACRRPAHRLQQASN
mmetsp:Transcript_72465/g.143916  ORF Transcript_72465/g.143916 Transcript_72465/m.143916 type:complete len:219 (-) Transcript_72465:33-689(-)